MRTEPVVILDRKKLIRDLFAHTSLDEEGCQIFIDRLDVNMDGQARVAITKKEILGLIEYPTVYTSEGDGMFINENRFRKSVDGIFGENVE